MNNPYLSTLSDTQLERLYGRLHDRLPDGGHFGWDMPTAYAVIPGWYAAYRLIKDEVKRRLANRREIG